MFPTPGLALPTPGGEPVGGGGETGGEEPPLEVPGGGGALPGEGEEGGSPPPLPAAVTTVGGSPPPLPLGAGEEGGATPGELASPPPLGGSGEGGAPPPGAGSGEGGGDSLPLASSGEDCCARKTVGGVAYTLVEEQDTLAWGCRTNCVYKTAGGDQRFCFRTGRLSSVCEA